MDLDNQRAPVSGATSGIGPAAARKLAEAGAEVVGGGRDPQRGADNVAAIEEPGGRGDLRRRRAERSRLERQFDD